MEKKSCTRTSRTFLYAKEATQQQFRAVKQLTATVTQFRAIKQFTTADTQFRATVTVKQFTTVATEQGA